MLADGKLWKFTPVVPAAQWMNFPFSVLDLRSWREYNGVGGILGRGVWELNGQARAPMVQAGAVRQMMGRTHGPGDGWPTKTKHLQPGFVTQNC